MDVAFVAEFRADDRIFRYVDARGASPIQPGATLPLEVGYCQRVVKGEIPELIVDASACPTTAALPETKAVPIGSHMSVPIRMHGGRLYGTFCCFSFEPDLSLTVRDLQIMRAFADVIADQVESEISAQQRYNERRGCVEDLLRTGQPRIAYQPIYDLNSRRMVGVEGLSRFDAIPQRTPDYWFAEAEAVGLGPTLEAQAIKAALRSLAPCPPNLTLDVNGSPALIMSGLLEDALESTSFGRITLEITEHASVEDYQLLLDRLAPLRRRGLRLAVDDAGAGFASLRHILRLEPDLVKLDVSLTRGIDNDVKRRALASALVAFARQTGTSILAEGVETAAELEALRSLGVTLAQGYYLAKPMPASGLAQVAKLPDGPALPLGFLGR
jgi:EAL domain-containing protein (putative c-di-GMP-specific phosphodiesterase class I)